MLFCDLETTGLLKPSADLTQQPWITEICVIKTDDDLEFVDELNMLVKPPIPIEPLITKLTGISDDTVADSPEYVEIHDDVVDFFLGERIVVGHNCPFDMGVLWANVARLGLEMKFPWPPTWICTAQESTKINGKRLKLRDLHEHATGEKHEDGAHRAQADVHALIRCFEWMDEKRYLPPWR